MCKSQNELYISYSSGHNTDGKFLERAGKVTYSCEYAARKITTYVEKTRNASTGVKDVVIADIKCGINHTVAVDTKGRVYTWGFAGYGRLGHSETKDEVDT
jgi:alpha-tubulin suppressor-like RCC1 family protein